MSPNNSFARKQGLSHCFNGKPPRNSRVIITIKKIEQLHYLFLLMLFSRLNEITDSLSTFWPTYLSSFPAYFTIELFSMSLRCTQSAFSSSLFNRHFAFFPGQLFHLPKKQMKNKMFSVELAKNNLEKLDFYSSSCSLPAWINLRTLCPPLWPASSRLVFPIASFVPSCCLALSDPPLLPISL